MFRAKNTGGVYIISQCFISETTAGGGGDETTQTEQPKELWDNIKMYKEVKLA